MNEGKQKKLLIIDDNKSITDMLSQYLTMKNFSCVISNNGRNALNLIMKEKYDIILLDLSMPEFTGLDVIESLEKDGMMKDLNIIVFTASSINNEEIQNLLKRGIKACIKKPVQLAELIKMIS